MARPAPWHHSRSAASNGRRLAVLKAIAQLDNDRSVAELVQLWITGRTP